MIFIKRSTIISKRTSVLSKKVDNFQRYMYDFMHLILIKWCVYVNVFSELT